MITGKVAKRYARALFLVAKTRAEQERIEQEFQGLVGIIDKNPELQDGLFHPSHSIKTRKGILEELIQKLNISNMLRIFLLFVADKGRLNAIVEIARVYEKLLDAVAGRLRVDVISAVPLKMTQVGQIKTVLERRTGKQVIITKYTEQSLIGGMLVKIGNTIVDGSVNGRLERMKERLMARS